MDRRKKVNSIARGKAPGASRKTLHQRQLKLGCPFVLVVPARGTHTSMYHTNEMPWLLTQFVSFPALATESGKQQKRACVFLQAKLIFFVLDVFF